MIPRQKIHDLFTAAVPHVYFQPPENVKLKYPCIVYELDKIYKRDADNRPYILDKGYKVTLIHTNPDNTVVDYLASLPKSRFVTSFVSENLHHYIYSIY